MKFKHFSIEEREKIQELLWQKTSIRTIAGALDFKHWLCYISNRNQAQCLMPLRHGVVENLHIEKEKQT